MSDDEIIDNLIRENAELREACAWMADLLGGTYKEIIENRLSFEYDTTPDAVIDMAPIAEILDA